MLGQTMSSFPLTLRGILALLGGIYLFFGPWHRTQDLVAGTLGLSLILITSLAYLVNLFNSEILRRKLKLTIYLDKQKIIAKQPTSAVLDIEEPTPILLPLLERTLTLIPKRGNYSPSMRFDSGAKSKLLFELNFPHRGIWEFSRVKIELKDSLGLTKLSSNLTLKQVVQASVYPAQSEQLSVPIISSSIREGDEAVSTDQRLGEPFDLKSYHPSDGMSKIVWKLYAKSGELFARHPEASMTPEGRVIVWAQGGLDSDNAYSAALNYLWQLELNSIEMHFYCQGSKIGECAKSLIQAEALVLSSAWNSESKAIDNNMLFKNLPALEPAATSFVIFASNNGEAEDQQELLALVSSISNGPVSSSTKLHLVLAEPVLDRSLNTEQGVLNSFIFGAKQHDQRPVVSSATINQLIQQGVQIYQRGTERV